MTADELRRHLDAWRLVPRLLVAMYAAQLWRVGEWFMGLDDPTGSQATFVSVIAGVAPAVFGFYVNSGGKRE